MPNEPENVPSERDQTDESLRVEREKVDDALGDAVIEETADAVISRARARADKVLAAARAKTDRQSATSAAGAGAIISQERAREDRALREERESADETLREERAEHVALLSIERQETDKDLSTERARSDEALATRDDFMGIVSHDLRNMLNSVVGSARLVEAEAAGGDAKDVAMHARRILRSAARMERLIGDLVDVASIEAGALAVAREVGDLGHVVMEAVDSFQTQASARRVALVADVAPGLPPAAFDPARILQVMTNLLSNAIKFTPAQGSVIVRVERIEDGARFAIRDTGAGIPADKLQLVFERFLQIDKSDRRGVGLGLYISKCIIQGHGGRIWAESTLGEGSTFYFTLPLRKEP